ncbi:MAG: C25 family cysteine peptidase [Chloroflexota bacterium]
MSRRRAAIALAALLFVIDPLGWRPPATAAPELPGSVGQAVLFHLQLATDIGEDGSPIGQGTSFPEGTTVIFGLLGWSYVDPGTELKLRLFQGDRFAYEASHIVENRSGPRAGQGAGFVVPFFVADGFPAGQYAVEVQYNGLPDEVVPFVVGGGPGADEVRGSGAASGPIPYKSPDEVLVVTRAAVLRQHLGSDADRVLAAAALVGDLHDLEADGVVRATPDEAGAEVHRLLRQRPYRYLLIVGNDDTVPYFHVENPMGSSESSILSEWELPADWLPTDNYYADLDGDPYGTPDLAVARIPSSDDADLLLTQLGTLVPPDGGAFALVNQERRNQAGVVVGAIASGVQVRLQYAPPIDAASFGQNPDAESARYLYILMHGIGVLTDTWSANTVAWEAGDPQDPLAAEWTVHESTQLAAVTVETDPVSGGVVEVGACYGGWTLDTIQEPVHKTAANSLALHYLKSGTRAFVADTHISYSTLMGPDETPRGRTGFELLFWRGITAGLAPIDAFQEAKVGIAAAIDALVAEGDIDTARINLKTLHYMAYLGRP